MTYYLFEREFGTFYKKIVIDFPLDTTTIEVQYGKRRSDHRNPQGNACRRSPWKSSKEVTHGRRTKTTSPPSAEKEEKLEKIKIPESLPVLVLRDIVVFPYMIVPLYVGRAKSKKAVDAALNTRPHDPAADPEGHERRGPRPRTSSTTSAPWP